MSSTEEVATNTVAEETTPVVEAPAAEDETAELHTAVEELPGKDIPERDGWVVAHDAIRLDLDDLRQALAALDTTKDWHLRNLQQWFNEYFMERVHSHHANEEEIAFPYLATRVEVPAHITASHKELTSDLEHMKAIIAALVSGDEPPAPPLAATGEEGVATEEEEEGDEKETAATEEKEEEGEAAPAAVPAEGARERGLAALRELFARFDAELREHFAEEEREIKPLLRQHFTLAEYTKNITKPIVSRERKSTSPQHMLGWIGAPLTLEEARQLLVVEGGMPSAVFSVYKKKYRAVHDRRTRGLLRSIYDGAHFVDPNKVAKSHRWLWWCCSDAGAVLEREEESWRMEFQEGYADAKKAAAAEADAAAAGGAGDEQEEEVKGAGDEETAAATKGGSDEEHEEKPLKEEPGPGHEAAAVAHKEDVTVEVSAQ